jgi:hypothetical protein
MCSRPDFAGERILNDIVSPLGLMVRKLETHAVLDAADRKALLALPYTLRT